MAITFQDYTATASQTDFAFNFPFLEDEHVTVEIDAVVQPTSAYSIVTSPTKKIVLNSGATAGQIVRVQRVSQPDENLVDFVNGSVLTESELDRAYLHNRYLAEESAEQNNVSLRLQAGVNGWNAQNKKLLNLANPAANQDAATKDYVDTQDGLKVAKAGDTMSGALNMGTNKITNLDTPTSSSDAATKNYIDTKIIDTAQLQDGAVTTAKLDADSVTNAKIADDSIDSEHYVDGSIDTAHIADNQITAAKISDTDHFFNVQSNGKVGIAVTNPQARLHVNVDALLPLGTIFYQDNITQSGTTGGGLKITHTTPGSGVNYNEDTYNFVSKNSAFTGAFGLPNHTNYLFISTSNTVGPPALLITEGGDFGFVNNSKVGIGTAVPTAPLEITSTSGGVIMPRMTTTQMNAISSPSNGEMIYNTTDNKFFGYANGAWTALH